MQSMLTIIAIQIMSLDKSTNLELFISHFFYLFSFTFLWFLPLTASPLSFPSTSIVSSPLYVAASFSEKPAAVKIAQLKKNSCLYIIEMDEYS